MLITIYDYAYKINFLFVNIADKTALTSSSTVTGAVQTVEATQLPLKFRRTLMDEAEISAINVCNMLEYV